MSICTPSRCHQFSRLGCGPPHIIFRKVHNVHNVHKARNVHFKMAESCGLDPHTSRCSLFSKQDEPPSSITFLGGRGWSRTNGAEAKDLQSRHAPYVNTRPLILFFCARRSFFQNTRFQSLRCFHHCGARVNIFFFTVAIFFLPALVRDHLHGDQFDVPLQYITNLFHSHLKIGSPPEN